MNRARIKEIANSVAHSDAMLTDYAGIEKAIESALLRFAEELLTQEPSEGMQAAGYEAACQDEDDISEIAVWKAMSAQLLKEVRGDGQ